MESLATTYVEFADDETPLKATCEIRMLHVGKAKGDVQDPESDPTRPRDVAPPTPVVEPKPDETFDIHWSPQEDPSTPVDPPAAERLSREDDPLGAYLDRVDDALDRLESGDPPVEAVVEPVVEPAIESVVEPLPESDLPETEVVVPPYKVRRWRASASD